MFKIKRMSRPVELSLAVSTTALLVFSFACSSRPVRAPSSNANRSLLDFNLTDDEAWKGGSREAEEAGFMVDARAVQSASSELFSRYADQARSGRVFHEKSHGCLTGKLRMRADRPEETRSGFFATEGEYDLIARFSNGVGFSEHDANPDVRGLALKIFTNNGSDSFDLLMTNNANPFGRDQAQFVEFMKANMKGQASLIEFAVRQQKANPNELSYLKNLLRGTTGDIDDPSHERYWSGHSYVFDGNRHMKFNVYPVNWSEDDQWKYEHRGAGVTALNALEALGKIADRRITRDKNYLRQALKKSAESGQIHYVLALQLEKDAASTPVEDTLVEWTERDSPSIPVADLYFDQQDFDQAGRDSECGKLRFSPGHYYPAHRPSGNMGRGRMFTYLASQVARKSPAESPDKSLITRWRAGEYETGK